MTRFKQGISSLLAGFSLITRPGIRLYVLVPLLINTLLFAGVIIYGANLVSDLINSMIAQWQWLQWLEWLVWPLFVIVSLTIVFFCFSIVANLVGAPFNGFLAEAVERHLLKQEKVDTVSRPLLEEILLAFKAELQKLLYFALRAIPLLLLFIIPIVNVSAPLFWFLFSAWMLALEYMDYPMSNHGLLFKQQREKLFASKQLTFGFGLGVMILTLIPVINFLAMPVAVAGATKMYVDNREFRLETDNGNS
ncbi:MAG: sulfate transporter CysZ [Gammaproteobacteria bacterium]